MKEKDQKAKDDEITEKERERRRRRRIKKGLDPDELSVLSILKPREDEASLKNEWSIVENETNLHDTRDAAVYNAEM